MLFRKISPNLGVNLVKISLNWVILHDKVHN